MDALLVAIVVWLSVNCGLPAVFESPKIERVPASSTALLRSRGSEMSIVRDRERSAEATGDVVAFYDDSTKTIFISSQWTGRSPAELSILVDEMVHHMQNVAGIRHECAAERERLAYEAQDKWLRLFGRDLEGEFGIDGLGLLVRTSCALRFGLH